MQFHEMTYADACAVLAFEEGYQEAKHEPPRPPGPEVYRGREMPGNVRRAA